MKKYLGIALLVALSMLGASCSGGSSSPSLSSQSPAVFVTGEDAPLASVVGFDVTINSITLNGNNGSPQVLSTPTTVDFARLLGLRSPLAFNTVPADTYNSVTFSLSSPAITWVDMSTTPPSIGTPISAYFNPTTGSANQTTVTVNFPTAMVVGSSGLAGLRMEFDIKQSVAVDGSGQITGAVNPTIYVSAVSASDPNGKVTDLTGGLVSVNAAKNSFIIQGPYGRQLTIDVNNSTQFNSGWNINDLAAPSFIGVQGTFQADGSLMASYVEVITTSAAFLSGRVLAVNPASGPAQQITMWVGETSADLVGDVDTVQTIDVSAVDASRYEMCFFDNLFTNALFNDSSVIVGQRIFVGGSFAGSTFTPQMVSLRFQGVYGTLGSVSVVSGNVGTFQLQNNGLIGYSLGGSPLTVATGNATLFVNTTGLSGLQSSGSIPVVSGGLLFVDPATSTPVMAAAVVVNPSQTQ